jgi:hypothetical protein
LETGPIKAIAGGVGSGASGTFHTVTVGYNASNLARIRYVAGVTPAGGATKTSLNGAALYGITFAGGTFVAVGGTGSTARVVTSTNPGSGTWTDQTNSIGAVLKAVSANATLIVAVGDGGKISTAPVSDPTTWTARTSGVTHNLTAVIYAAGYWWAATDQTRKVLRSADGVTWSTVDLTGGIDTTVVLSLFASYL